jgi:hypothetical protein
MGEIAIAESYDISAAATYMQDKLFGQGLWRWRLGRGEEDVLAEVTGMSLTWDDLGDSWRFVFSLRRNGEWLKVTTSIGTSTEGVEPPDVWLDMVDRLDVASAQMMSCMMDVVFPDVLEREDKNV